MKSRFAKFLHSFLVSTLSLLFVSGAFAQSQETDEEEIRWYEVEVIVFQHNDDLSNTDEVWRRDIKLSYPNNWVKLIGLEEPEQEGFAANPETLNNNAVATNGEPTISSDDDLTGDDLIDTESLPEENDYDPMRDIAFHVLPDEELQLSTEARQLRRRNQYRVLFHQAWRQPTEQDNPETPAVIIWGGDLYGNHHELEGSIRVSLRRYLHVETNLWLSQFATNFGQQVERWPEPPARPSNELPRYDFADDTRQGLAADIASNNFVNENEGNDNNRNLGVLNPQQDQWFRFEPLTSRYDNVLSNQWIVENIVLLKQSRKVQRSTELHYIDHPRLGVLVLLTPYEPPKPPEEPTNIDDEDLRNLLNIPQ